MLKRDLITMTLLASLALPALASANARLISVVPTGGGCVSGPTGPKVQSWDIEPGETYTVTITDVVECGNVGTDPTINVRVNSMFSGNVDLLATNVGVGTYEFDVTLPVDAICTFPIFYCTTPGQNNSGTRVVRNDGAMWQAHLRAASFDDGCTNPTELGGDLCDVTVAVDEINWGGLKVLYRD